MPITPPIRALRRRRRAPASYNPPSERRSTRHRRWLVPAGSRRYNLQVPDSDPRTTRATARPGGSPEVFAVVQFPGSNDDRDARFALKSVLSAPAELVWHQQAELPPGTAGVLLPG